MYLVVDPQSRKPPKFPRRPEGQKAKSQREQSRSLCTLYLSYPPCRPSHQKSDGLNLSWSGDGLEPCAIWR
ncbi:hypothetical protein F4776DRAFT_628973 [Hypoxylon sp. NC0597]|nr:hypothetical protein F4776DRAFT_628973 [Hypoxylon sp. NC0597]